MEGGNVKKKVGYGNKKDACQTALNRQSTADNDEISQPNKLNGSVADFQNLHRELLLGHKRGLLFGVKPELKRVMEQRRGKLHKEEELARLGPSDLETELRKRQQKLKEYELEEVRQRENQDKIPEFVRVKDNLRRTQMSDHANAALEKTEEERLVRSPTAIPSSPGVLSDSCTGTNCCSVTQRGD